MAGQGAFLIHDRVDAVAHVRPGGRAAGRRLESHELRVHRRAEGLELVDPCPCVGLARRRRLGRALDLALDPDQVGNHPGGAVFAEDRAVAHLEHQAAPAAVGVPRDR